MIGVDDHDNSAGGTSSRELPAPCTTTPAKATYWRGCVLVIRQPATWPEAPPGKYCAICGKAASTATVSPIRSSKSNALAAAAAAGFAED